MMRLGWLAIPLVAAMPACNPVQDYQAAARSLQFRLERVEPSVQLELPLERSRVTFRITAEVENPSNVPFHLRRFEGSFRLETAGQLHRLGSITLVRMLDLPAGGKADLTVDLAFAYQDLAGRWTDLLAAVRGEGAGAWELEGTLRGDVHGVAVRVPVHTRRGFGEAP